jgi:hypothetical protein
MFLGIRVGMVIGFNLAPFAVLAVTLERNVFSNTRDFKKLNPMLVSLTALRVSNPTTIRSFL